MPDFLFRPQAALDLRRRQEDLAKAAWGEAASALERAEAVKQTAEQALLAALGEAAGVHDPTQRTWYRNWIHRCRTEIGQAQAVVVQRRAALTAATARRNAAHRDVRALERLRARALAAWQLAARRAEQKELDWLGSVGHALRDRERAEVEDRARLSTETPKGSER